MYFCAFPQFTYSISKYLENCWNFYFQHVHMCFIIWKASFFLYIYIYIHLDINVFNFSMTNIPLHEPWIACQKKLILFFFSIATSEKRFSFSIIFTFIHTYRRYNINRKWSGEIIFVNTKNSSIALSINPLELTILISILKYRILPYNEIENLHIISSK